MFLTYRGSDSNNVFSEIKRGLVVGSIYFISGRGKISFGDSRFCNGDRRIV